MAIKNEKHKSITKLCNALSNTQTGSALRVPQTLVSLSHWVQSPLASLLQMCHQQSSAWDVLMHLLADPLHTR